MKQIFKYVLQHWTHPQGLPLWEGAEFLDAQVQDGSVCMWFAVDRLQPSAERCFLLVPPGRAVPANGAYLRTLLLQGGDYVLHLFELPA